MFPVLLSVGPLNIFSFSIFLIVAWLTYSFVFWRMLRSQGVDEEKIFDLTFYSTVAGLIFSRIGFVVQNLQLFDNLLKVAAIWIVPGLSLYGGFFGAVAALVLFCRRHKVRLAYILDALAFALPYALIFGEIGSLLDGTEIGLPTSLPWGISYIGFLEKRHPVQLYEIIALVLIIIVLSLMARRAKKRNWAYGIIGVWFFLFYSAVMFCIESFKVGSVYFVSLSVNQWIIIAVFAESLGALYVRGGGKQRFAAIVRSLQGGLSYARHRSRTHTNHPDKTGDGPKAP